jgi:hypothetical protein
VVGDVTDAVSIGNRRATKFLYDKSHVDHGNVESCLPKPSAAASLPSASC